MKRFRFLATGLLALLLLVPAFEAPASRAGASVSVSFFFSELAPSGEWAYDDPWGTVWVPYGVGPGWQPYLYGRWAFTDYGWSWISDDPWSPDTWHYGTWVYSVRWGWVWVPGTVWAPAWVTWCWSDGYVGWAPVSTTFVLSFSGPTRAWDPASSSSFVFVPTRAFASGDIRTSRVDPSRNAALVRSSVRREDFTVTDGIVRTRGPSPAQVERAAGVPVRRASIRETRVDPVRLPADLLRSRHRAAVVSPAALRAQAGRAFVGKAPRSRPEISRGRERNDRSIGNRRPDRPRGAMAPAPRERHERRDRPALARRDEPRPAPPVRVHERPAPQQQLRERPAPQREAPRGEPAQVGRVRPQETREPGGAAEGRRRGRETPPG